MTAEEKSSWWRSSQTRSSWRVRIHISARGFQWTGSVSRRRPKYVYGSAMTSGAKRSSGSAAAAVGELAMDECYAVENVPLNVEPTDPKAARFNRRDSIQTGPAECKS